MNLSTIEALAIAWARIAEEAELPAGYEGTATPEAHRACEVIQERIREHVVATNDMRLFGLLHLLGQASLRMEQALWPEEYGVWGATEQKVHLSPAPARKPLWRLVSSGKPSFCRTLAGTDARPSKRMKSSAEKSFSKTKSG